MGNSRSLLSIASIAAAAAFAVMPITASPLAAATISVTIQFDLVKVTTSMAGGFLVYTASPVGKGPYETRDGADPIEFFKQKPDGDDATFLNGFTGASIVNNALQPRYFGSVASSKGPFFATPPT
jgi:hypothetical protein